MKQLLYLIVFSIYIGLVASSCQSGSHSHSHSDHGHDHDHSHGHEHEHHTQEEFIVDDSTATSDIVKEEGDDKGHNPDL